MNLQSLQAPVELRLFFAHPKSWNEDFIVARTQELANGLRELRAAAGSALPLRLATGREDWQALMGDQRKGRVAWNQWTANAATGMRADGQARYHAFVVPLGPVGKGTADLLNMALYARKPVACWDPVDRTLRPVISLVYESANYSDGWRLECSDAHLDLFTGWSQSGNLEATERLQGWGPPHA